MPEQRATAAGFMTALALAFEQVFDPERRRREPTVQIQPAGPPPDGPFDVQLDDDPARSRVIVHWSRGEKLS